MSLQLCIRIHIHIYIYTQSTETGDGHPNHRKNVLVIVQDTTVSATTLISSDGIMLVLAALDALFALALYLPFIPMKLRRQSGTSLYRFASCGAALHSSGHFWDTLTFFHLYRQHLYQPGNPSRCTCLAGFFTLSALALSHADILGHHGPGCAHLEC